MSPDRACATAPTLALILLASAVAAQPILPGPAPDNRRVPAPTAEDIAAAYTNSLRFEYERTLRRVEAAINAARSGSDGDAALLERLRAAPGSGSPDPAEGLSLTVHLYGCTSTGAPRPRVGRATSATTATRPRMPARV